MIAAIDAILQIPLMRWALLAAAAVLLVVSTWLEISNTALEYQLQAEKGTSAEYAAKLGAQNAAIKKAGEDMQIMKLRLQTASADVAKLQTQLKQRQTVVREVILQGDCPTMVQQVIDEVRK